MDVVYYAKKGKDKKNRQQFMYANCDIISLVAGFLASRLLGCCNSTFFFII